MTDSKTDRLIDAVENQIRTRCSTCADTALVETIDRWLARRAAGEILPCLTTMHEQLFETMGAASISSVRRHIRVCLRINHATGRKILG